MKRLSSEYEVELNISMATSDSMCFQELTVYFQHDDESHNHSCNVTQVTAGLNHLQCLIHENHCGNASVNNYTVYVVTNDGTESNSLNVTCSARTIYSGGIMTMSSQTSNQSKATISIHYYVPIISFFRYNYYYLFIYFDNCCI